jgi:hypothetical protein
VTASVDVVIPTVGRPCLARLLGALADAGGPPPGRIVVVDDRPAGATGPPPGLAPLGPLAGRAEVVRSGGRGPAAARNAGWRRCDAAWIAFLDDDVVPRPGWFADLRRDLGAVDDAVAAVAGRIVVPLPAGRRPTDAERGVAALERAPDVTADMAFRRAALVAVGGFDERFRRAYREDTDIALRLRGAGWRTAVGRRVTEHPPRPGRVLDSVRAQAGNADDVLMTAIHGPGWRAVDPVPGRSAAHMVQTGLLVLAPAAALAGRRGLAAAAAAAWAAGWARFAWQRILPGPRTPREVGTMALTSALIPPAATAHRVRGVLRARRLAPVRPG